MPLLFPRQTLSGGNLVAATIQNLRVSMTGPSSVAIRAGSSIGLSTGRAVVTLSSDLTADPTVSGPGGLDQGTEAASTWYYIYLIYDYQAQSAAALLSANSSAPVVPPPFTDARLVGAVYNDASSNFVAFEQMNARVSTLPQVILANMSIPPAGAPATAALNPGLPVPVTSYYSLKVLIEDVAPDSSDDVGVRLSASANGIGTVDVMTEIGGLGSAVGPHVKRLAGYVELPNIDGNVYFQANTADNDTLSLEVVGFQLML